LSHLKTALDSARITATIFKRANDPLSTANLYLATAENEIQYNAPNGINTHLNVMRKAHTDSNGVSITLPSSIGDSIEVAVTYRLESNWNHNILSSFAILSSQNSVVNAQKTSLDLNGFFPTSINDIKTSSEISIYPNPISVGNNLVIETIDKGKLSLFNNLSQKLLELNLSEYNEVSTHQLKAGIYFYTIQTSSFSVKTGKVVIH
jgi:hypothetical protein